MADEGDNLIPDVPPLGGEEGGTDESRNPDYLRVSEINLLRRYSNRVPFSQDDRKKIADAVNDAVRSNSFRRRMAGVKAFIGLDKLNLGEVALLINANKKEQPIGAAAGTVQVNVAVVQEALRSPEYLEYLESRAMAADRDPGDVRQDGEPRALEAGPPSGGDQPDNRPGDPPG